MDIDESSISGVTAVFEAIFKELEIDINAEEFVKEVILTAGDLKSGLNLIGAQDSRIGYVTILYIHRPELNRLFLLVTPRGGRIGNGRQ
ncbi:hypothetical protein FRC07_008374, partial [Ceratobasidium sp. 392]